MPNIVSRDSSSLALGTPNSFLVIGWFTPDYRPLAEKLAANLAEHGAPFHLFAKEKSPDGWNTLKKPSVVLEAMDLYPGKTLVLMDVDCVVVGDIEPVTDIQGDVGITVMGRNVRQGRKIRQWVGIDCSSRVVVFNPTHGARRFAEAWKEEIEKRDFKHDEYSMCWAFLHCPDVRFQYINQLYSGREISLLPEAVISHDSEHDKIRKGTRAGLKEVLRRIERRLFRTGKTKNQKLQQQLSITQLRRESHD